MQELGKRRLCLQPTTAPCTPPAQHLAAAPGFSLVTFSAVDDLAREDPGLEKKLDEVSEPLDCGATSLQVVPSLVHQLPPCASMLGGP